MIAKEEYIEIQERFNRGQMPTPEEIQSMREYAVMKATAALAANHAPVKYQHCGGENIVAAVGVDPVCCEWCGNPLDLGVAN